MALRAGAEGATPFEVEDRGVQAGSPELSFEALDEVLIEVSACPFFPLAAGALTAGGEWSLGDALWGWLFPGTWYVRAACARTGRHLGAWSFEKTQAARTEPVELGGADGRTHAHDGDPQDRRAA